MCHLGKDLLSPGPRKLRAAVVLSGIAVLPSLPKKLSPGHRTNSQTPSVRMPWHPLFASSSALCRRRRRQSQDVAAPSERVRECAFAGGGIASEARNLPAAVFCCSAFGPAISNLFRISTCKKFSCNSHAISTCETKRFNSPEMNTCRKMRRRTGDLSLSSSTVARTLSSRGRRGDRRFCGCPTRGSCVWARSVGRRTQPRCHPERSCGESHQQDELSPLNKVITANSKAVIPSERYAIARSCARWRASEGSAFRSHLAPANVAS